MERIKNQKNLVVNDEIRNALFKISNDETRPLSLRIRADLALRAGWGDPRNSSRFNQSIDVQQKKIERR